MKHYTVHPTAVLGAPLTALLCLPLWTCPTLTAADLDPRLVRQWPGYPTGAAQTVALSGNYAYVVAKSLQVLDLSAPAHPELIGSVPVGGAAMVTVSGRYAFVADHFKPMALHSLHIVDIADPAHPKYAGHYLMRPFVAVSAMVGMDDYVYVGVGQRSCLRTA